MHQINKDLATMPNDPQVPINLDIYEQYIGNTKLSGYGFLPKYDHHKQVRRPPPSYKHPYPPNLNPHNINYRHTTNIHLYTDGSTISNPGRSAYAWISQASGIHAMHNALEPEYQHHIHYPCAINVAELEAIKNVIERVYELSTYNIWPVNTHFTIHSDSQLCVNLFSTDYYPHNNSTYDTIQYIYYILNQIPHITFSVRKVRAHVQPNHANIHEQHNIQVDKLANEASAQMPNDIDCNDSYYTYYHNNNNSYINAWHNIQFRNKCNTNIPTLSDNNDILYLPPGDAMLRELRILTYYDAAILNQIRMGYLTLKSDKPWLNYYTCTCDAQSKLTVKHFLLECQSPDTIEMRNELRNQLTTLNPKFNNDTHFNNIHNLIYPHLQYTAKELKSFDNLTLRTEHLQHIIEYCRYRFPD